MSRLIAFINRLSLRQRFLIEPLLGLVLLGLLTAAFIFEAQRQNALLVRVAEQHIVAFQHNFDAFARLSEQHMALYALLANAATADEQTLYDAGKMHLDHIYTAIADLERASGQLAAYGNGKADALMRLHNEVLSRTRYYRKAATAAVEMPTVNLNEAAAYLANANDQFVAMNRAFGEILNAESAAIAGEVAGRVEYNRKSGKLLAAIGVLVAVLLLVLSLALSRLLARSLQQQIDALTELGGEAGGHVAAAGAHEVERLARTVDAFRSVLLRLRGSEHALQKTNAELRGTVRELEAFAYSVAHDLRAPLRSIDGFSQMVIEESAGRLGPVAEGYLRRVRASSQRMARLIDDLLALSRVTRSELSRQPVDLSALACEIGAALSTIEPDRRVVFSVEPGMHVDADPSLLRIALENLLGNAWKFTGRREEALVEVGALRRTGQTVYYVRDNGAGFDMRYANKLFGPFQRLHGEAEFRGTGIGLAIVQRVMQRHGGDIWAEAVPGEGATFYFRF